MPYVKRAHRVRPDFVNMDSLSGLGWESGRAVEMLAL